MASSSDRTEDSLPRPELNPLLNPLLAGNMGRWAEVYFTSPPEKREEAVLELLRELEAQQSDRQTAPQSPQPAPATHTQAPATAFESAATELRMGESSHCDICGHDNSPMHQFCGMCGSPLQETALQHLRTDRRYDLPGAGNGQEIPAHAESHPEPAQPSEYREPIAADPPEPSPRDPYDLSPFQSLLENEDASYVEDERPPSVRYRYYIGVVLAILILALGYMAWSSSRGSLNAQGAPSPPPPAVEERAPGAPNTSASPPQNASQGTPRANSAAQQAAPKPADPRNQIAATTKSEPMAMSPSPSTTANPEDLPSFGSGGEEFAMAQHYLNGAAGQARDSAEAAKWLWKSIAKHNGPAMLALADLYLKGDGVSKNCDQARVLLDSAARRGTAGAGERLRNLQAFGCQ